MAMITTSVFSRNIKAYNSNESLIVNQGGTRCFDGSQMVKTKSGEKKISEIKKDDIVFTFNEITKTIEENKVLESLAFKNEKKTVKVKLKNGSEIICTEDHEFYFEGGWHPLKYILSLK